MKSCPEDVHFNSQCGSVVRSSIWYFINAEYCNACVYSL